MSGATNCIQKKFRIKIKELSNPRPHHIILQTLKYFLVRRSTSHNVCLSVRHWIFIFLSGLFKLYLSAFLIFFVGQTEPKILRLVFNNSISVCCERHCQSLWWCWASTMLRADEDTDRVWSDKLWPALVSSSNNFGVTFSVWVLKHEVGSIVALEVNLEVLLVSWTWTTLDHDHSGIILTHLTFISPGPGPELDSDANTGWWHSATCLSQHNELRHSGHLTGLANSANLFNITICPEPTSDCDKVLQSFEFS